MFGELLSFPSFPSSFCSLSSGMLSAKRRKAKSNTKATRTLCLSKPKGEIQRFFPSSQAFSPQYKMAEPRDSHRESSETQDPRPHPQPPRLTMPCQTSAIFCLDLQSPSLHPLTLCADAELRALLRALPTKTDIETLIARLKELHRQDLQAVMSDVQCLSDRLSTRETTLATLEHHMTAL